MKIQCDVCERNPATVICCADEAALCAKCDVEVHAANKLASKHQRLQLHTLSNKLPSCDICQDKAAFIFCVEDRALFCRDCDESIHVANTLAANHQRYLATGIKVALGSKCTQENNLNCSGPSDQSAAQVDTTTPLVKNSPRISSPGWAVDDLLELSELEPSEKKGALEVGETDWWTDMSLFGDRIPQETLAPAEVPQIPASLLSSNINNSSNQRRSNKASSWSQKKPRIEMPFNDDAEFFLVPDLG